MDDDSIAHEDIVLAEAGPGCVYSPAWPGDPDWGPHRRVHAPSPTRGMSFAEFGQLLVSPLTVPPNGALVGHPAWRNEPSHLTTAAGKTIRVTNRGGRGHTFTEVANFGGGFIGGLNIGLTAAEECVPASDTIPLAPGATIELTASGPGLLQVPVLHPPVDSRDNPRRVARASRHRGWRASSRGPTPAFLRSTLNRLASFGFVPPSAIVRHGLHPPAGAAPAGGAAPGRPCRRRRGAGARRGDRSHFAGEGAPQSGHRRTDLSRRRARPATASTARGAPQ